MKNLCCEQCGLRVFFENVLCESCGAALGFEPGELRMAAFNVQADGAWQRVQGDPAGWRPCANYAPTGVCNWMVAAHDPNPLCVSCRTTQVLPGLDKPENLAYWTRIEQAKRRLFYNLLSLGLPVPSRAEDPEHGVSFQFLEQLAPTARVMTGHDSGVITLNIAEADDAHREKTRTHLHEPYRTLLGHFRHEIGHYYWDRLIAGTEWHEKFRALFGDERQDYAEALAAHYATPRADWHQQFVSVYASSHPWEDWAECWAHYMHIHAGLETASAWGLRLDHAVPGEPSVQAHPVPHADTDMAHVLIEQWLPVSQFANAMARSLGNQDNYPFVMPEPVVRKLDFLHRVVVAGVTGKVPMNFLPPPREDAEPERLQETASVDDA